MIPSNQLSVILAIAAAVWGLLLIWSGVSLNRTWAGPFSTVSGVIAILLSLFESILWRVPYLHPWFVKVPNVRGTWHVVLNSEWVNPETGRAPGPIQAFMVIRQTYSTISMRLHTAESSSQLLTGKFIRDNDGTYVLAGVYSNVPKLTVRHRSPIHYGSLLLNVSGEPPESLIGHYWTDRGSRGEMRLTDWKKGFAHDFESAAKLYSASSGS